MKFEKLNLPQAGRPIAVEDGQIKGSLRLSGATLEANEDVRWPTIRYANTWLLPGVPEIFRLKLPVAIAEIATRVLESAA